MKTDRRRGIAACFAAVAVACQPAAPKPMAVRPEIVTAAATACLDSALAAARDSVDVTASAWIHHSANETAERRAFDGVLLQTVVEHMHIDGPIALPPTEEYEMAGRERTLVLPPLRSHVAFMLERDGAIRDLHRVSIPKTPQLDFALVAALEQLRDSKGLGPVPAYLGDQPLSISIEISWMKADSDQAVALFAHRFPRLPTEDLRWVDGTGRPEFPPAGRIAGMRDSVTLEADVDVRGVVDSSSVVISNAHYREFALSARRAALATRFVPARAAGCPIKRHVEMPYTYMVNGDDDD
jgi:TonB family protein